MQRSDEKSPLRVVAYFSRQTTVEERHFHSFELDGSRGVFKSFSQIPRRRLSRNPVESPVTSNVTSLSACNVFKISVTHSFNEIQHTDPQLVLIKCILNNSCDGAKDINNFYVLRLKDGKIYRKVDDALEWAVPQDARWKIYHMY